jgi:ketosteroid isomerase-like protein
MRKVFLAVLVALTAVVPGVAQNKHVERALLKLDEAWSHAAASHNLEKTLSFYMAKSVLLPPNAPIVTNSRDMRAAWAPLCDKKTMISWKATKVEVAKGGDMAYTYGTYMLRMPDGKGGMFEDKGKFVEIWQKQKDRSWKCIVDTFNSDLPGQ